MNGSPSPAERGRVGVGASAALPTGYTATVKIATFNAASVRARLPILLDWLATNEPDVLGIQETKVEDAKFPREEFEELGYHVAVNGQKSWNGVCLLTREPAEDVAKGLGDPLLPEDARLIAATVAGVRVVNTYVPNGTSVGSDKWVYKLRWMERFAAVLAAERAKGLPLVWIGDVNVAPTPLDVYDSPRLKGGVGHHPEEFVRLERIVGDLVDCYRRLHPNEPGYTFWDFTIPNALKRRMGWRIDHVYATTDLAERLLSVDVDLDARQAERPSDHTFVTATFG